MVCLFLVSTLVVSAISNPIYAESISKKYYTQPNWIYQIEIQYTGDEQFYVFWDGKRVNALIPDEKLNTSKIKVHATSNETMLQIFDSEDANTISADVRILDVIEIRPLTVEEIKIVKSQSIGDPRDKKILELESRVITLENEKSNLEKEVTRLNGIVETLQDKLEKLTEEFLVTIQNQLNWFQNQIRN